MRVASHRPGKTLTLKYLRNGRATEVKPRWSSARAAVMSTEFRVRRLANRAALDDALAERLRNEVALAQRDTGRSDALRRQHAAAGVSRAGRRKACPRLRPVDPVFGRPPRAADLGGEQLHQSRPLLAALALRDEQIVRVRTELPLLQARKTTSASSPHCCARRRRCASA